MLELFKKMALAPTRRILVGAIARLQLWLMPLVYAEVIAKMMRTRMDCVTQLTTAYCEYDACGVCNGPGATFECGCDELTYRLV